MSVSEDMYHFHDIILNIIYENYEIIPDMYLNLPDFVNLVLSKYSITFELNVLVLRNLHSELNYQSQLSQNYISAISRINICKDQNFVEALPFLRHFFTLNIFRIILLFS